MKVRPSERWYLHRWKGGLTWVAVCEEKEQDGNEKISYPDGVRYLQAMRSRFCPEMLVENTDSE